MGRGLAQIAPSPLSLPQSLLGIDLVTRALLVPGAGLCLPMVLSVTSSLRVNTQDIDWATVPVGWGWGSHPVLPLCTLSWLDPRKLQARLARLGLHPTSMLLSE